MNTNNDFYIEKLREEPLNRFGIKETLYQISFKNFNKTFSQAAGLIKRIFTRLISDLKLKMKNNDKISLRLFHSQFSTHIEIPFVKKSQLNVQLVIDALENVVQSYKEVLVNHNNNFIAKAQVQNLPEGSGRRAIPECEKKPKYIKKVKQPKNSENHSPKNLNFKESQNIATLNSSKTIKPEKLKTRIKTLKKKQKFYVKKADKKMSFLQNMILNKKKINLNSIIPIENKDRSCLLRAILIGKSFLDHKDKRNKRIAKITHKNHAYAFISKQKLNNQVKVIKSKLNLKNKSCGIEELKRIEMFLKFYSITLIDGRDGSFANKILYSGVPNKKFIYILYTESHYDLIPNIKSFLKKPKYCHYCKEGYSGKHSCPETCKTCERQDCLKNIKSALFKCVKCKLKSKNIECFRIHNEKICSKKRLCDLCGLVFLKKHVCLNQKYCVNCEKVCDENHKCYLMPDKFPIKAKKNFCFFDYETMYVNNKHVPNLVCAKYMCIQCIDNFSSSNESEKECIECETKFFYNNDQFGEWIFQKKDTICIAHNLRSFDGIILLEYILNVMNSLDRMPKILLNGSKILTMKFRNVKFIDSLSFLPMPLDKFTKTFDLKELKKRIFLS